MRYTTFIKKQHYYNIKILITQFKAHLTNSDTGTISIPALINSGIILFNT